MIKKKMLVKGGINMNVMVGVLIVLFSGGLGIYLDVCLGVDSPIIFWAVGTSGMFLAQIVASRG